VGLLPSSCRTTFTPHKSKSAAPRQRRCALPQPTAEKNASQTPVPTEGHISRD
jgi:hypothetical protein